MSRRGKGTGKRRPAAGDVAPPTGYIYERARAGLAEALTRPTWRQGERGGPIGAELAAAFDLLSAYCAMERSIWGMGGLCYKHNCLMEKWCNGLMDITVGNGAKINVPNPTDHSWLRG